MLINIVGSPHSGKTTLAARMFDHFKSDDLASEFITERARQYIVEKRFIERLKPGQRVYLSDQDQIHIMRQQVHLEGSYVYACPRETAIVSDSSPLNALLYMSPEARKLPEVQKYIKANLVMKPMVFWTRNIPGSNSLDVNRIHDPKFCEAVDQQIPSLLKEFVPNLNIIEVRGTPTDRYHKVLTELLKVFLKDVDPPSF